MHHAIVFITLNLIHKQCHKISTALQSAVTEKPQKQYQVFQVHMDYEIRQISSTQNMLYSRGAQHRARGPNMASQKFENGTQAIYWMQSMLFKVNWSTFSSNQQLTTWCSSKACLHLWIKLRQTWNLTLKNTWKCVKTFVKTSQNVFKIPSRQFF